MCMGCAYCGGEPEEYPCAGCLRNPQYRDRYTKQEEDKMHYDNLCAAAEHFGLQKQADKLVEEMGELLALIGRLRLGACVDRDALAGEIADVYNMLDQICILLDMEEQVQDTAEHKMERALRREGL